MLYTSGTAMAFYKLVENMVRDEIENKRIKFTKNYENKFRNEY
jgi:hypothetical protein